MIVKVVPKKPIPGILPKNKWIDTEMELDLNQNEVKFCMQYGTVYDESGKMIDDISIKSVPTVIHPIVKPKNIEVVHMGETATLTTTSHSEPLIIDMKDEPIPEVITTGIIGSEIIEVEPSYPETSKKYCILEKVSTKKENDFIILEVEANSNYKLEGNLYGLFNIISGPRPSSVEYLLNDSWIKFGSKFANFEALENEDKLTFRFVPKNENEFTFRILIKEANEVLASLEEKINPVAL